jgi:RNA polymerase sigma factor (sigma-70 family)
VNASPGDAELLEAWRAGDEVAGSELLRRHFDGLFRFFRARFDDGVPDLVQRTLLAAVEARDRLPASGFRAYLFGIAHKQMLMHWRKASTRRDTAVLLREPAESTGGSPSKRMARSQEQRLLVSALRRLPLEMQVLLQLHYWDALGVAEIAHALGIPVGTVKSRLFRARELVKESIATISASPGTLESTLSGFESWVRSLRPELASES